MSSPVAIKLIHALYTVPVRPRGAVYRDYCVAVADDRVVDILPLADALQKWPDAEMTDLPEHVLLPGLINAHTHSPMTLLRGFADDTELHVWLKQHIWPAEREFVGPEFVADGTRLAVAEMIRAGTTCFNDMYFFPDATIEVCVETGIRASIGITIIEIESAWASDVDDYIDKGLQLADKWQSEPLISFTLSPHAPYTVSDETLVRVAQLSKERGFPVHIHLLETEWEVKQSYQQHDLHPLNRLESSGLLDENLQAVHMAQLSSDDIDRLAALGVNVIHCPQSNLKLASGICPLTALLGAGVNVALGTDGAAANNDLDLLAEAQTAALLAKGISGDAKSVDAFQALEMMTINGAHALGLEQVTGSIEIGKQADFCALDLSAPETQPLYNVVSQVIYAASRRQFTDVWVAGKRLLYGGELTTIDLDDVICSAGKWQTRLAGLEAGMMATARKSDL
ncbi:MAG: TRZ/ATZ family hydrolase [Xanthomonadales bacterium]|nr:TRZ/ATZ family hydrolase [Gammaproteobacteria bacterium]MBT8055019.1 TRZ/ATZ family hydrolase [Gammaproteobacteria bacterium]NND56401.1 TRZ/ATZ family hydrolase [Xanthomonadales bacterium]NNK50458.1 TRZ/ATZ family hydrolase [Xanthomonadales bacterium]